MVLAVLYVPHSLDRAEQNNGLTEICSDSDRTVRWFPPENDEKTCTGMVAMLVEHSGTALAHRCTLANQAKGLVAIGRQVSPTPRAYTRFSVFGVYVVNNLTIRSFRCDTCTGLYTCFDQVQSGEGPRGHRPPGVPHPERASQIVSLLTTHTPETVNRLPYTMYHVPCTANWKL